MSVDYNEKLITELRRLITGLRARVAELEDERIESVASQRAIIHELEDERAELFAELEQLRAAEKVAGP